MTILNININDFGGTNHHIEEVKNKYGKRWYIQRKLHQNAVPDRILYEVNQQTDCI
jgi:hypothetical protein